MLCYWTLTSENSLHLLFNNKYLRVKTVPTSNGAIMVPLIEIIILIYFKVPLKRSI